MPSRRPGRQESAAAPASGSPKRRPAPTSARGRSRTLPPSRPARSCYRQSRSGRAAQSDSCSRPRCAAAPAAHSAASRSGRRRHRHPHRRQSVRAARAASQRSRPSAWLTSSKLPSPRLRKTRTCGPGLVSTIAARSIHPSLSISIGVTPHPRSASFSGQIDALESPADVIRALRHCATA